MIMFVSFSCSTKLEGKILMTYITVEASNSNDQFLLARELARDFLAEQFKIGILIEDIELFEINYKQ